MIMYINFEIVQLLPNLYLHIILSTLFIFHSRFFLGVMDITQQGIVTHLELWISSKAIVIHFRGSLVRRPFSSDTRSSKRPPLVEVLPFIFILIPWIILFAKLVSDSIFGYQVYHKCLFTFMLFKAFTSIPYIPVNSVWINRRNRNLKHTFWLLKLLRIRSCQVYLGLPCHTVVSTNSRL